MTNPSPLNQSTKDIGRKFPVHSYRPGDPYHPSDKEKEMTPSLNLMTLNKYRLVQSKSKRNNGLITVKTFDSLDGIIQDTQDDDLHLRDKNNVVPLNNCHDTTVTKDLPQLIFQLRLRMSLENRESSSVDGERLDVGPDPRQGLWSRRKRGGREDR